MRGTPKSDNFFTDWHRCGRRLAIVHMSMMKQVNHIIMLCQDQEQLLVLPYLEITSENECDAYRIGIPDVLMQQSMSVAHYSGKLYSELNYPIYDNDLCVSSCA